MLIARPGTIDLTALARRIHEVTPPWNAFISNASKTMTAPMNAPVYNRNALILVPCRMHVVHRLFARPAIILAYVHARKAPPVTHSWAVFLCNIVSPMVNVQQAASARMVFVILYAQRIVIALLISCVYAAFANPPAKTMPLAPIFNFV